MCFVQTAVLKVKGLLRSHFQLLVSGSPLEPGFAWEMMSVRLPQVVGFAADAAPSVGATSERRSEIWQWDSTQQLSGPLALSL